MTALLLKTKLHTPPFRPGLIPRARLIEKLDAGGRTGCKLILISAPAGYGKTTLLSEWTDGQTLGGRSLAWLSLDEGDNDPLQFAMYLTAALQTLDETIGQDVQAALQAPQPPPLESLFTALLNQLDALPYPFTLVLDDYHLITALPIHQALTFLLDHLPPQMCLVITTRSDPLLPLARLRGRGQLLELRQEDLRFTLEETAVFLRQTMGVTVSPQNLATLAERTEGWIVGLQMAALSLQGQLDQTAFIQTFSGSNRYILDYLLEEVLSHQSVEVQQFLLHTSILERLTGALCDTLLETTTSQVVLEYLERANLFIVPLDDERRWFRYHHLFADLLRQRLRQFAGTEVVAALYLRASAWYEREGFIAEAMACALTIPNYDRAAAIITRHGLPLFYRGEIVLLYTWLKALPEATLRAYPLLSAVYASCSVLTQQSPESIAQAGMWLDTAEAALADVADRDEAYNIAGFVLKFRAYLARFRGAPAEEIIALSQKSLERLPAGDMWFRSALYFNLGAAYWEHGEDAAAIHAWTMARQVGQACDDLLNALSAVYAQSLAARIHGRLHEAAAIVREAYESIVIPIVVAKRSLPITGVLHVALGIIQVEWNDLEDAERALTQGLASLNLTSARQAQFEGHLALARLKQAQGDAAGAMAILRQIEQLYPRATSIGNLTPFRSTAVWAAAFKARLWLQQAHDDPRRLADAENWARQWARSLGTTLDAHRDSVEQLTLVRLYIAQHRSRVANTVVNPPAVFQFLERQLNWAKERGHVSLQIEVLILQALAFYVQGEVPPALNALRQALILAEPEGYQRIFLDEGPSLAELLRRGVWRAPRLAEYVAALLRAFPQTEVQPDIPVPPADTHPDLIEALSERELDVLRLLNDGLSNQQIAERLFVTVGTVKTHAHNIYAKLGVKRRTQAVARARELKLL